MMKVLLNHSNSGKNNVGTTIIWTRNAEVSNNRCVTIFSRTPFYFRHGELRQIRLDLFVRDSTRDSLKYQLQRHKSGQTACTGEVIDD